jgi:hypothetical protein
MVLWGKLTSEFNSVKSKELLVDSEFLGNFTVSHAKKLITPVILNFLG